MRTTVEYRCSCGWEKPFSIYHLYFCPYCYELRCPYCLQEEIVCYYCPNCLFEVPSALVRSGKNRCSRNCYQCPICTGTLTLVNKTEDHSDPPSEREEKKVPIYELVCSYCGWMSRVSFEKPSAVSAYYLKKEEESSIVKEFKHLYTYYEQLIKKRESHKDSYQSQECSWYESHKDLSTGKTI
jgi:dynactin-4